MYALWLSVFARVLAGELLQRHGHIVFENEVALGQSQRVLESQCQAHAQRTRSFIISFAVRQILQSRIRLGLYLGSSMAAVWVSGNGGAVGMGVVAKS